MKKFVFFISCIVFSVWFFHFAYAWQFSLPENGSIQVHSGYVVEGNAKNIKFNLTKEEAKAISNDLREIWIWKKVRTGSSAAQGVYNQNPCASSLKYSVGYLDGEQTLPKSFRIWAPASCPDNISLQWGHSFSDTEPLEFGSKSYLRDIVKILDEAAARAIAADKAKSQR